MALVDEVEIFASAGRGGDGVVRWLHEKSREFGGPAGGDGGRGGNVYAEAVRDISALTRYRSEKRFRAERGESGKSKSMHGKDGEELVLPVPAGSVISNKETGERFELLREGERTLLLKGGNGGLGNVHFKGSVNQRPKESTPGKEGESARFHIELQLIADVGLIGLPNAGKTSLLNILTRANARVGSYAFTTLEPNLGVMQIPGYSFIFADIPGLIEGAAEGKGLGHKFLRHIRRTKMLLHLISLEQEDAAAAYRTVRSELGGYDKSLLEKPEVIILTKRDLATTETLEHARRALEPLNDDILTVSVLDPNSLETFRQGLAKRLST